jgi:methenyltetrahydrofolate cyclohydrolase
MTTGTPISVWQETLGTFVENVASSKPVPGGGAVATLSICLAAALLKMLLELTAKERMEVADKASTVATIMTRVQRGVGDDITAFNSYLAARRMPKLSEQEQLRRGEALAAALVRCTEVPLDTARAALALIPIAQDLVSLVPDKAISDFGAALAQLDSGLVGLFFTANINLRGTTSDPSFATVRAGRDCLAVEIASARQALSIAIDQVAQRIGQT